MVATVISRMESRMTYTTGRRLMWMAGLLPGNGWKSTVEKYEGREEETSAGVLNDLLIDHALYSEKHVKLHPMQASMRQALQDKIINLQLPESDERAAFPLPLDDVKLAQASGQLVPVSVQKTPDGVGLVLSQIVVQKTREEVQQAELASVPDWIAQYDQLVGVKLKPVPLFHVLWIPHERNCVEFRLDCTLGTGTRNAFQMHSLLRRYCADLLDVKFEEAHDLFPAILSLYRNLDVGRATEMSFATPTNGLHNERMLRREEGDCRSQAYHLEGVKGIAALSAAQRGEVIVDDDEASMEPGDILVFSICVEWTQSLGKKIYPISLALRGSGPSGRGSGGNPQVKAAMLEGCLTDVDYEQLIEVLVDHASLDQESVV